MKTLSKKALASKMMAVFGCCILVMGLSACSDDDKSLGQTTISVTSFSPESGLPGTEVTISGSNFGDEAKVFFNEAEATDYVSRSSTSIVVRVPENASTGRIGVLSGKSDYGFSATEFQFIQGAVIERLSMTSAPVGSTLTITGHNFFDLDLDDITVWFGSASSKALAATSTEVTTTVPEGAEDGPIAIQFGSIQKVYGPEFTVGAIVNALQDYYFSHNDVVMTSGKSNPCSYSDVNGGGVCFYDKGVYADGYNSNSEVKSFTIWDSITSRHFLSLRCECSWVFISDSYLCCICPIQVSPWSLCTMTNTPSTTPSMSDISLNSLSAALMECLIASLLPVSP